MKKSRFTTEQIIGFIKQADAGMAVAELARQHGFSPASFYAWRAKYGGMEAEDAKRLTELESENNRLKRLLAEAHLDIEALKIGFGGKTLAPQCKREAVRRMLKLTVLSERRACRLAGLSRDSFRHPCACSTRRPASVAILGPCAPTTGRSSPANSENKANPRKELQALP